MILNVTSRSPWLCAKVQLSGSALRRVVCPSRSITFYQSPTPLSHHQDRLSKVLGRVQPTHAFNSSPYRKLSSSVQQKSTDPYSGEEWSPERTVQWQLDLHGEAKWGWVVYRCTYKPELEGTWQEFKRLVNENIRQRIAESDAPQIADSLDWPIIEDPELEGASHEVLRRRWRDWVRGEKPDVDTGDASRDRSSRYTYFIQIDEEALRSVLYYPNDLSAPGNYMDLWSGYVNMIKGWEEPLSVEERTDEYGDIQDNEDWMHICANMLQPYFYVEMDNYESWYTFYCQPPDGVCCW